MRLRYEGGEVKKEETEAGEFEFAVPWWLVVVEFGLQQVTLH